MTEQTTEENVWDKTGRYTVQLDPPAFFEWTLDLPRHDRFFRNWEDTRNVTLPGRKDRTRDLVARLDRHDRGGQPWGVVVEIQSEPDSEIVGRTNEYGGSFWRGKKPDPERGSRFVVAALVVNLSGRGRQEELEVWEQAGLTALVPPKIINVIDHSADEILGRIASGQLGLALLSWVPLMTGGDQPNVVEKWKELASQEADPKKRADYGVVAKIFAEKTKCVELWNENLEGWNVEESVVLKELTQMVEEKARREGREEGREEGRREGMAKAVASGLQSKFGEESQEFAEQVRQLKDLDVLQKLQENLFKTDDLEELRKIVSSNGQTEGDQS